MANQASEIEAAIVSILTHVIGTDVSVMVKRGRPAVVEGDTLPMLCVSVQADRHEQADFDAEWFAYYTVAVVLVTRKTTLGGDTDARSWRQAILREMTTNRTGWGGVDGWDDCNPIGRQLIDPGLLDKGYHYTPLSFEVRTLEAWA